MKAIKAGIDNDSKASAMLERLVEAELLEKQLEQQLLQMQMLIEM